MDNWFPLSKSMMEDSPEFRKLTPGEKVLWFSILSQANYRGDFYKADIEWAVELDLSLSKVRQARRKFQALGWLSATPGWKAKGGRLATTYHYARWAKPEKGVFFARMRRYTWEWFLVGLRLVPPSLPTDRVFLRHADLLLYAYLCYFWTKFRGGGPGEHGGYVTKRLLQSATNLQDVRCQIEWLCGASEGLFDFRDEYHRIRLLNFTYWKDPREHEGIAEWQANDEGVLRQAIEKARARQVAKDRSRQEPTR